MILNDVKNEWIQRKECLRRIQVYCEHDPEELYGCLPSLYEPLNKQIQDLRSSIIRECCSTIVMICKTFPYDSSDGCPENMLGLINQLIHKD